jgi:FAD binding domain
MLTRYQRRPKERKNIVNDHTMKAAISLGSPVTCYGLIGSLLTLLLARHCRSVGVYINWHLNPGIGGPYLQTFYPTNDNIDNRSVSQNKKVEALETQDEEFMTGLKALKNIVNKVAKSGKRLRAYGSRWTVTEMPYTTDYMIDTHGLNYAKVGIDSEDDVLDNYKGDRKDRLVFVQSGVMIKFLYKTLFAKGLTLVTAATSDGASMAGGISTGTHDSAVLFGSMTEYVKGMHLVIPGKTVYVQRSSDPVLTEDYVINTLGADELLNSDDMFDAALVSFGCFGVIHGYLIEAEALFRLKVQVINLPFSHAKDALYSLDPAKIAALGFDLDDPSVLPWLIQSSVNSLRLESEKGSRVRVMQRVPLSRNEIQQIRIIGDSYIPRQNDIGNEIDAEAVEKMLALTQGFGDDGIRRHLYGEFNDSLIQDLMKTAGFGGEGYPIDLYTLKGSDSYYVEPPIPTTTMELCVPLEDLEKAFSLILEITNEVVISPTVLDLRYTAPSSATLSPSKFAPISAWISFSSLDTPHSRVAYEIVYKAFEERRNDIRFTFHWGKELPLNNKWVEKSHGQALSDWKRQRAILLPTREMRHLFSNHYTDSLGVTLE